MNARRRLPSTETSQRWATLPPRRWREYLDAMLYVLRTGCPWRHLPHDFAVSCSAARKHFLCWCRNGTCHTACARRLHWWAGRRHRHPTAQGQTDRATISHVWVDKGYTVQTVTTVAANAGVTVDVVSGPKPGHGFVVQRRRGWSNAPTADQPLPPPQPPLRNHPGRARRIPYLSQIALLLDDSTAASCSTRSRALRRRLRFPAELGATRPEWRVAVRPTCHG